jgi:hypothetical protein
MSPLEPRSDDTQWADRWGLGHISQRWWCISELAASGPPTAPSRTHHAGSHTIAQVPKAKQFITWINLTTPFMPITSDGNWLHTDGLD